MPSPVVAEFVGNGFAILETADMEISHFPEIPFRKPQVSAHNDFDNPDYPVDPPPNATLNVEFDPQYGSNLDYEFDQEHKHQPNMNPEQFQTHDWHHNSINKFKHAPYVLHQPHGDYKNVHPGHPYENRFEATVTGEVGKGLPPLPSKEEWRKPSKEMPKLPTWDNKETISTEPTDVSQLTSDIQKNNESSTILLKSYRADGTANETAPLQVNDPNVRVIEIKVRGRPNPPAPPPVSPPENPPEVHSPENSTENITVLKSENATANSPTIHLANLTAEPPPMENATESSTANNLGGIPPLAATAASTPQINNAATLAGIPPLAPVTGVASSGTTESTTQGGTAGAIANATGSSLPNVTAGSPEGSTSNVMMEKSSLSKSGAHKRSRIRQGKRKGTKRSKQPHVSKNHRRHLANGHSHHQHHHHGNNEQRTKTGSRRSHIRHTPVMQVLKDFTYKLSHFGQREGDADDSHLSPAEIII